MSQNDFAGFAVPGFYFKRLMAKLNDMAEYVDAKLILIHGMMKRSCWVDKKARSECRLCSRGFSTTRRRQHCRLCGEVFCKQCLLHRGAREGEEDGDNAQRTFNVVKTKFCRVCVAKVRDVDVTLPDPGKQGKGEDQSTTLSAFADSRASTKPDGEHTDDEDVRVLARSSSDSELLETIRSSDERDGGFVDDDERSDLDGGNRAAPSIGVDMSKLMSASQMMRRINAGAFDKDNSAHYQLTTPGLTTNGSRRTITQCIAEQEELLRRLVLAAQEAQP